MDMKKKICLVIIFGVYSVFCFPQDDTNSLLNIEKYSTRNGERLLMQSNVLKQDKEIYIGLPAGYSDTVEYPLVIVLEGEIVFESFAPVTRLAGRWMKYLIVSWLEFLSIITTSNMPLLSLPTRKAGLETQHWNFSGRNYFRCWNHAILVQVTGSSGRTRHWEECSAPTC